MTNQYNSEETTTNEQQKLAWSTPELEVFSVKEKTLAGPAGLTDSGIFS